jgi:hypothetical protein
MSRCIIIIVHLFLDVNFQGSPKIKAQPLTSTATAVRPIITMIVKATLAHSLSKFLGLESFIRASLPSNT